MNSIPETITSLSNKRIKNVALLMRKQSERKAQGLMVVEGEKEIRQALTAGVEADSVFICHEIVTDKALVEQCIAVCPPGNLCFISKEVFAKVAYRDDSGGIIFLGKSRYLDLESVKLSANPLVVILETVEKPGNLGAVLRTCDAAGVDLLIICDPETDIYNPNVIRSGIGCVFTQKVIACISDEAIAWLKKKNIAIFAAALQTEEFYHQTDLSISSALVFGTEATGLTEKWRLAADKIVKIPMLGTIDSLNVSNSVAIMVYEAKRQRGFTV